jgi:hypothetical protein
MRIRFIIARRVDLTSLLWRVTRSFSTTKIQSHVYVAMERWQDRVKRYDRFRPPDFAGIHAALGDKDKVFATLEQALKDRSA